MNKLHFLWNFTLAAKHDRQTTAAGAGGSLLPKPVAVMCARLPASESPSRAVTFLSTVKVHQEFRHCWALILPLSCDLTETCREAQTLQQAQLILVQCYSNWFASKVHVKRSMIY